MLKRPSETSSLTTFDAVVVGAGFAGLYMLHRLRGLGMSVRLYEAGAGVGGTWYWNRYPGARCDVESMHYSYSFSEDLEQEWEWTERYSTQSEILRYLDHVADRFHLRSDIQLETRVTAASFDDESGMWHVRTDKGDHVRAQYCVMATGCLSAARIPDIKGLDAFRGEIYHTGQWPHEAVDFTGQRVGVIGTGSSGIQVITAIAEQAGSVTVFQRTPNFSMPARNAPLSEEVKKDMKVRYRDHRTAARESFFGVPFPVTEVTRKPALEVSEEDRQRELESRWSHGGFGIIATFADVLTNKQANDTVAEFVRRKIRETVNDPRVAELLSPKDHPIGTKRPCVDTGYFDTFNRNNVTLVDVRKAPIQELTASGLRTVDTEYDLDSIVFATGFDAMTGALHAIDIRGAQGRSLRHKWAAGPRTYLGIASAGFPNLFLITGPGSPSVLSNMVVSIEQHVEWITGHLEYMRKNNLTRTEPTLAAEDAWVDHVNDVGSYTLYPAAASWYTGANIPGKPRVFMPYIGGVAAYRRHCDAVAANSYQGFLLGL